MSTPLAQKAEEFVKAELAGNDGVGFGCVNIGGLVFITRCAVA